MTNDATVSEQEPPADEEVAADEREPELDEEALERRRAALSQVRAFGDPVLNSRAAPVTVFDDELAAEAERMFEIMRDAHGVGLAATQLGTLRRLLVFAAGPDATPTAVANPVIEWSGAEQEVAEEGCLSLPGIVVDVERPVYTRVSGVDTSGHLLVIEASGLEARVLHHEIDHLDGTLILDRTERGQRRAALRALREGTTYSPSADESDEE